MPAWWRLPRLDLPVLDLTAPRPTTLSRAVGFVARHRRHGAVYVHCALGYGRSACAAAACLLASGEATGVASAIRKLRAERGRAVFSPAGIAALRSLAGRRTPVATRPSNNSCETKTFGTTLIPGECSAETCTTTEFS